MHVKTNSNASISATKRKGRILILALLLALVLASLVKTRLKRRLVLHEHCLSSISIDTVWSGALLRS